mgnify:CR=1 FL=1|tara:strand:- start:559 stop:804 length:246 start_codon:yes stop_codon:yes gene_type:complete
MKVEIVDNIPIPKSRSKYADLLEMKVGECAIFYDIEEFKGAKTFLRRYFKIISQTRNDPIQSEKQAQNVDQYLIWRTDEDS